MAQPATIDACAPDLQGSIRGPRYKSNLWSNLLNHNILILLILLMVSETRDSNGAEVQLICRSGPSKPKLETLTLSQWSTTSLHKLVETGTLSQSQVFLLSIAHIYNL